MDLTPPPGRRGGLDPRLGWAALVLLAALAVLSLWFVQPPAPVGADAPAEQFSAARAYAHVEHIGAQIHVAGSPAAGDVRDYIVATLQGYGLQTQIQDGVGEGDALGATYAMARVRNVIARLPGTASTGRLFAMAHYDSVQVSYGANDDGAGVASLLETARAMTAGPRPRNDVYFVFTEAEEACLCGAEAFVSQNPLAADGGVVLNFEARGSSGPAIMFETSVDNAGVVGVYGASVPYPVATSFAVEVYRILPNDTDFTPFRESGRFTGLNSAYIDGSAVYHSSLDRSSYLDKASLQHHGSNALALTRAFGAADLGVLSHPSSGDSTYFPVLGLLLRYPAWLTWPLAVLGLLSVAALAVVARRRGLITLPRTAAGLGLGLVPLLVAPVLTQVLWLLLVAVRPGYRDMIDPWQPGWYRGAVVALVAAVVLTWYGLLRRRFGAWTLAIGGLGWLALLGIVLAALTPGGSYLAALPALAGAIAGLVAVSTSRRWAGPLALAVAGAVAVLILAPTVLLFFPALGLATGGAAALFATMLALSVLALVESLYAATAADDGAAGDDSAVAEGSVGGEPGRRRLRGAAPAIVAGGLAVVLVGVGLAVDRFDAAHPTPAELMYALDADTGQAYWVSSDTQPGPWASRYVTGHTDLSGTFPLLSNDDATGPAAAAELPAPAVTVVADMSAGGRRTVRLTITAQRPVRLVYFRVEGATVLGATVDGRDVPASKLTAQFGLVFHAPPAQGLPVTLVLDRTSPVRLRVLDGSDGLTGLPGFSPRPADVYVEGSHDSDLVMVARTYPI